jgi:hypothetical protein
MLKRMSVSGSCCNDCQTFCVTGTGRQRAGCRAQYGGQQTGQDTAQGQAGQGPNLAAARASMIRALSPLPADLQVDEQQQGQDCRGQGSCSQAARAMASRARTGLTASA